MEEALAEDNPFSPLQAARDRVRKLRLQALRGAGGRRFRQEVRGAYNETCLFTGVYLPVTELTSSAGVDAAHILPWAQFDLNDPRNGICLSKLCHWAFDEGILKLTHDSASGGYQLSIPDGVKSLQQQGAIDLSPFEPLEGWIPTQNLPSNSALWPDPGYLKQFNDTFR